MHMLSSDCKKYLIVCSNCDEKFTSEANFKQHINRKSSNKCKEAFMEHNQQNRFTTSQVKIPWDQMQAASSFTAYTAMTELEIIHQQVSKSVSKKDPVSGIKIEKAINESLQYDSEESGEPDAMNNFIELTEHQDVAATVSAPCLNLEYNVNMFVDMKEKKDEETASIPDDMEYVTSLRLLKLLIEKNISLTHYDDFMRWKDMDSCSNTKFLSLDALLKKAARKTFGDTLASKMKPRVEQVDLSSGRRCHMVVFDPDAAIFDLLNNVNLTCSTNMIFDEKEGNPFHVEYCDYFDDVNTSPLYWKTYTDENINPHEEVLCPLALYIDELQLDAFGKLGLEPVVVTLLIYNRETRNQHKAHRVIGYMPNFKRFFGNKSYTPDQKAADYHECLSVIMTKLKQIQNKDGFVWDFQLKEYPQQTFRRKLKFPLFYVVGDAKGNDMLAGRYGSRNNTACVARDCDVGLGVCDNPLHRCKFHRHSVVRGMSEAELKQLSFRKLKVNAFDGIWFGSQPYGLLGALPPEPLHLWNLGLIERIVFSFFARLSPEKIKVLDRHVGFICSHSSKQSDRNFPNMETFCSGISDAKRLSAKEKLARVFCIYVTLLTKDFNEEVVGSVGRQIVPNVMDGVITQKEYCNWVKVFEETLLFSSWIYHDQHPKHFFIGGRKSVVAKRIVKFMTMYKKCAPRADGMGLKILKFHQLLHLWWIIRMFASLLNVDGARGECNNQYLAKSVGKKTQQQHKTLNFQTAQMSFKRDLILQSIEASVEQSLQDKTNSLCPENLSPGGSKFVVSFDYSTNQVSSHWKSWKMRGKSCRFSPLTLEAVFNKLKNYNGGTRGRRIKSIHGFTEVHMLEPERATIRACPSYRSCKDWHDWVNIEWDIDSSSSELSAQALIFLDMNSIEYERTDSMECMSEHLEINDDCMAIVHSVNLQRGSKTMPIDCSGPIDRQRGYFSSIASWHYMEEEYQMVSISTFQSKCFVLVDTVQEGATENFPGTAKRIVKLMPKNQWHNKFIDYSKKNDTSTYFPDLSVTDEDLKYYEA